jgi:hypothetical protein
MCRHINYTYIKILFKYIKCRVNICLKKKYYNYIRGKIKKSVHLFTRASEQDQPKNVMMACMEGWATAKMISTAYGGSFDIRIKPRG